MQVGLLNVDGYYNSLLELFDNGVQEGFIKPACRHIVLSASTADELLTKMEVNCPFLFSTLFFVSSYIKLPRTCESPCHNEHDPK